MCRAGCPHSKQKSLAEGIVSPPQGIMYGVGGLDAAFIWCLSVVFMRCDAMRCDAMRCAKFVPYCYSFVLISNIFATNLAIISKTTKLFSVIFFSITQAIKLNASTLSPKNIKVTLKIMTDKFLS